MERALLLTVRGFLMNSGTSWRRLTPVLMLALAGWGVRVAAIQTQGKPERFTALAINFDAPPGAVSTTVDINVNRWSTDAERTRFLTTLLEKGPDKLLDTLRDMPTVGNIRTPDSVGYDLHYARR